MELCSKAMLADRMQPAMPETKYSRGMVSEGSRTCLLRSKYFARVQREVTALNNWMTPAFHAQSESK